MSESEKQLKEIGKEVRRINDQLRQGHLDSHSRDERVAMTSGSGIHAARSILISLMSRIKNQDTTSLQLVVGSEPILLREIYTSKFDQFAIGEGMTKFDVIAALADGKMHLKPGSVVEMSESYGMGSHFRIGSKETFLRLGTIARTVAQNGFIIPVDTTPIEETDDVVDLSELDSSTNT